MNNTLVPVISPETAKTPNTAQPRTKPQQNDEQPPLESLNKGPTECPLPTFPLLINGVDIDTGKYEYFPFADLMLTDPRTTIRIMRELKAGLSPDQYQKYVFARYCVGTHDSNQHAMAAAYEASREFRYWPLPKRARILMGIYDLLLENKDRLMELMVIEGHPAKLVEWEFSGMEQVYRKQSLDFYNEHMMRKVGESGNETCYWRRIPDGIVCVSPPKNAPCSSSIIAGFALLGGNTLIVKPPLRSPIACLFLWRNIVQEALVGCGAPVGTLNLVLGNSKILMNEWMLSPVVNDIFFIGDTKTGLDIGQRAYQHGKKAILELSGNDMLFVWKDGNIAKAVASLMDAFLGSMQICMVPKKAFIHEDIFEEFERAFMAEVQKLKYGLPSDPETSLTPVVKIREFFEFLDDATAMGATLLCGGKRVNHNMEPLHNGSFITPTVIRIESLADALEMRCIQEENFFPLMPLIKVSAHNSEQKSSAKEHPSAAVVRAKDDVIFWKMIETANGNEYGLRASVWVKSPDYIEQFMEHLQNSGLLRINSRHVGFSPYLASHGGPGKSGGPYGEMNYIWEKTTHLQGVSLTRMTEEE